MTHNTTPISLMDKELVHLLSGQGVSKPDIAAILGISKRSVYRILKTPLNELLSGFDSEAYLDALGDGNYQTTVFYARDGSPIEYPAILAEHGDPTMEMASFWEELEQGLDGVGE